MYALSNVLSNTENWLRCDVITCFGGNTDIRMYVSGNIDNIFVLMEYEGMHGTHFLTYLVIS